ncbi:MAG: CRISPR-associated endonuclease Cas2 [Defluviitaleaceae bacterium]|nr:CRISPR-associated endonuclease Cas2 [Defluviitaleaceae bacterium]
MMLLIGFDLPRKTILERAAANKFRKRLIRMGFSMKQFSFYERVVNRAKVRDKIISQIKEFVPERGEITLYELPDEVNDNQLTILGEGAILKSTRKPRLLIF